LNEIDVWLSNVEDMTHGIDFTVELLMPSHGKLRRKLQQIRGLRKWRRNPANKIHITQHMNRFKKRHLGYFPKYSQNWRLNHPEQVKEQHVAWNIKRREKRRITKLNRTF
jgi:hypothetical protein